MPTHFIPMIVTCYIVPSFVPKNWINREMDKREPRELEGIFETA